MFKEIHYQYIKLINSLNYMDIIMLFVVIVAADRWYSLAALLLVTIMQLFQICSTFKWKGLDKSGFYGGWRKRVLECSAKFCTAVSIKLYYIIAFSEIDPYKKTTLIFQISFFFILIPNFTNWLIKSNTLKPI